MGADGQDEPFASGEEQAIRWTILLQDNPDDPLVRQEFHAWLAADPAHGQLWAEIRHVHNRLADVAPAYAIANNSRMIALPAQMPVVIVRPGFRWRSAGLVAAGAMCLALLVGPQAMLRLRADHHTGVAEIQSVRLADGSIVQLAPKSAIAVDYNDARRDVRLLKGEAFFTVTPNRHRPFRVIGAQATVTVLGTAFDVRDMNGPGKAGFVGVEHGRVRVAPVKGAGDILTGGQAALLGATGGLHRTAMPPTQVAAWRDRQLIVQDEPITTAIDRLRPWFGGMIFLRGEGLARQRLTGVFNASDPVEALHGMARAYGGRVTEIGGWVIIYSQD